MFSDNGLGFGPLEPVVSLPGVTDIAVTPCGAVWIDRGEGMREVTLEVPFSTPARVREYAMRLCAQLGRRLDDACPIADAASMTGVRVHAVLEPLVPAGAAISIRLPPRAAPSLGDIERSGFLPHAWVSVLRRLLAARASIVVSGGTGTGKTTLVRALLRECEPTERVVIVEEIREIGDLGRGNFVSLVSREKNVEGAGEVSLSQLVTATLRMRPDRIVLGECRGPETADVLRAFNTGHRGGMVTIHSNGIERLPQRLVALGQLSGMSSESLVTLADGAFDVALHLERAARGPLAGSRRVSCIGHLCGDAPTGPLGVSEERGSHQRAKGLRGEVLSTWDGMGSPVIFPGWEEFSSQWGLEDDGGEVT